MAVNIDNYNRISEEVQRYNATLVAVSKLQSKDDIMQLYNMGHRDFGENYVQELMDKQEALPKDIRWHFIGHLQRNKVKYIAPFVHLIHGVDSFDLLKEIGKQAKKSDRVIHCLLQVHIAEEETKFGLDESELKSVLENLESNESLGFVSVNGLMGMASFSDDEEKVLNEMKHLKNLFDQSKTYTTIKHDQFNSLSMGMSGDYLVALQQGSTMVRVGSLLFGARPTK